MGAAALLVPLVACGGAGDSGAAGGCGGSDIGEDHTLDETTTVSVGVIPIVDVAPIYLGQEQGFFEDRGSSWRWRRPKAAPRSCRADVKDRRIPMLQVKGVQKVYESHHRSVEAVRDLTFTVRAGELACLVGPSGCGKTTLLKCVSGLLAPSAGEVQLADEVIDGPPEGMAMVFQEYGRSLFPWMTNGANVELPLRERRIPKAKRRELVADALQSDGLDDVSTAYPWQLSGGMQQRVAIARAVACRPAVLLMDEPFAAVDAQTRADLEDLIRALWRRYEITILFVTHDIDEAVYLGEREIVLTGAPSVVQDDVTVDLPSERDQITTRALPRFTELRGRIYEEIRRAKGTPPRPQRSRRDCTNVPPD
ncbi:MAG TPA: ATP-binding cassette domain-containing protein [Nocardioidaceae bacterium]|nr:ATP-binding cassette domain-containing protein [Nocardioidaceae bacterium]